MRIVNGGERSDRHSVGSNFGFRALPIALTAFTLLAAPLDAQLPGVNASARLGIASPSDDYQSNCGHTSLAFSLDVQGKRRLFPQLSVDHFYGSGGGDVKCVPAPSEVATVVGGLRIERATRVGLGAGARVGRGIVQLEGAVLGGFVVGRGGFGAAGLDNPRRVLPHVGGQAAVVLFRYAVLSAAFHYTRLSLDVLPVGGGPSTTRTNWSPMTTLQVGARIPVGRK